MRKGFGLIDAIFGLFILALITSMLFTTISSVFINYSRINARTEMIYLGEGIYERLISKDDYSSHLIDDLASKKEVIFDDIPDDYLDKYESRIVKTDEGDSFLEINIIINPVTNGGDLSNVEFKGTILK